MLLFGVSTSIAGLALKLFNNANAWCWIAHHPPDCTESYRSPGGKGNCERGDNAGVYRWAFWYAPIWFVIFWAMTSMTLIYWKVFSLDKKVEQYTKQYTKPAFTAEGSNNTQAKRTAAELTRQSRKNSRKVANQGMFYDMSFLLTWIFPSVARGLQLAHKTPPFTLMFLFALFAPSPTNQNHIRFAKRQQQRATTPPRASGSANPIQSKI